MAAGVSLVVESAFRTMDEQRALYQAYLNGTGNLAAEPGYSNSSRTMACMAPSPGSSTRGVRAWWRTSLQAPRARPHS